MDDTLIVYLAIWITIAFVVGAIGSEREVGYWGTFTISLFLSPFVAITIALISKQKNGGAEKHRYKAKLEQAKLAAYKGNNAAAIDYYMEALYFLENDYKNMKGDFETKRTGLVAELKAKVEELKFINMKETATLDKSNF